MRMKNIAILLLLLGLSLALSAQEAKSRTALGLHFGTSSGNGYSMRWMGEKHGLQGTLGAYTAGNNDVYLSAPYYDSGNLDSPFTVEEPGKRGAVILGLNYLYMLDHFRSGRLYIFSGGSYQYFQERVYMVDYTSDGVYNYVIDESSRRNELRRENRWTVGVGPGFELELGSQFRFSFELPITFNWKDDIVMYIPQAGLYYYFK